MATVFSYPDSRALLSVAIGARVGFKSMLKLANTFREEFSPMFGIPTKPLRTGESFDANNDLHLCEDGRTVLHRDGHVSYGGAADALVEYNKRHMTREAFVDYYGDDDIEEEFGLLHGV